MHRRSAFLHAIALSCVATSASSQILGIGIYPDPAGEGTCIDAEHNGSIRLYVVVKAYGGGPVSLSGVRFWEPQAYCGVYYWQVEHVFPNTYYCPPNTDCFGALAVDFGSCLTLPVHVLTIEAIGQERGDCCYLSIEGMSAVDCAENTGPLGSFDRTLVDTLCQYIPPSSPYPADGATFVPRDVTFSWSESPGPNYCANVDWYNVYLGTNPDPPLVYFSGDTFYDPPYLLAENTTYYWSIAVWGNGPSVKSPVWSFSTGGPVTVEHTTWGRIKALYR